MTVAANLTYAEAISALRSLAVDPAGGRIYWANVIAKRSRSPT
jgi:hypothetical protein